MAEARANAARWGIVLSVAGLLSAAAWWLRDGEVALPSPSPLPAAAVLDRPAAAEPVAASAEPIGERALAVQPETRITGVVLDREGRPLVGLGVMLQRDGDLNDAWFGDKQMAATDEHGEFRYEQLLPATYLVATTVDDGPSQKITLLSGETKRCDLQFTVSPVRLWGEVRRNGRPAPNERVTITGRHRTGALDLDRGTNREGVYHGFLPPGTYSVAVFDEVDRLALRQERLQERFTQTTKTRTEVAAATRSVVLADGAREVRCDFAVVETRLHVQIDDVAGDAIADLEVHATGTDANGATVAVVRKVVRKPGKETKTTFDGLPPGHWRVFARAPTIVETESQNVELSAASPVARVVLRPQPGSTVRVSLRGPDGRSRLALPGALPVIVAADRELACIEVPPDAREGERGYLCSGVPPGPAEVRFADREVEGRRSFLAFDPQPAHAFDVVQGELTRVELQVEPRAFVRLRAVERYGREDPFARLTLFAGEREVMSHESKPRAQRWLGYLPPGEYRVVVERKGGRAERQFTVARQDLNLDLRP